MRALIIDDSKAIRTVLSRILAEIGFETFEAGNGADALLVLRQNGAMDLALVDWNMPGMSGLELVQIIRADRAYDEMRLMMATTETGMSQMSFALAAGANEYIMKPFTKEMMADKLALLGIERH